MALGRKKAYVESIDLYEIDRSQKIGLMTALYVHH